MAYLKGEFRINDEKSVRWKPSKLVHGKGSNRERYREIESNDKGLSPSFGVGAWLSIIMFVVLLSCTGYFIYNNSSTSLADSLNSGTYDNSVSIKEYIHNNRNILSDFLEWCDDWGTTHKIMIDNLLIPKIDLNGSNILGQIFGGLVNAVVSIINVVNSIVIYIAGVLAMVIDFVVFVFKGY